MGAANKLHPESLAVADVYDTVNCRLCRIMRKEGRKRGIRHLKVLYSSEPSVHNTIPEGTERRQRLNLGTVSYMPAIMGQMIAGQVIRDLAFGEDDDCEGAERAEGAEGTGVAEGTEESKAAKGASR